MPKILALWQPFCGEMPERLNGLVSKTRVGATLPGVQIPLSPPLIIFNALNLKLFSVFIIPDMPPDIRFISLERSSLSNNLFSQ